MKKKLGVLNKKIRHSKRKHNNLISKQNLIKKKIEELKGQREPEESFNPVELEQAHNRAYRSYRIIGRSRMDVGTFFDQFRQNLIDLMNRELTDLGSAKVQTTAWIRFIQSLEDDFGNVIGADRVEKPYHKMTEIHQGSDLNEIVNEMIDHIKVQIENPALANSRFVFDEVLFLDVDFHQLNLTRGSSYIPLPDWIASKKAVINPKNENDEECLKWAVTVALHHEEIGKYPQRISNIMRYANNYNWSGLEFPVAIMKINEFEKNNEISINVLGLKGRRIHVCRKLKYNDRKNVVNLLLITDWEKRHYTAIKSLSRLLGSSNSKHGCKQHFCLNCLQSFHFEESRDNHFKYCKDNKAIRIEMPKEGSFVEFNDGQNQFKVPFTMYADFEAILKPIEGPSLNPEKSYTKEINQHIPSGFCVFSKFAYGKAENPLKLYRGEDCVEVFCDYVENEVKRLYHMFPEKPLKSLTHEEWREFNKATKCHICSKGFQEDNPKVRDHCHILSIGIAI